MAALLRYGAARACRLLTSYTRRNLSIYQRSSPALYQDNILKACLPSVNSSRCLANETLVNEAAENPTAEVEASAANIEGDSKIVRKKTGSRLGHYNYERNVRQLGTIFTRQLLLRTFNEILNREGRLTSLQAYQTLRNCGTDLIYERPERRIELAHYFWDRILELGIQPDVTIYNGLLSVYIQNNHRFNPLEVLEQMQKRKVEPNRTTLLLLMQGYAEQGDVTGAFKLLEFIKAAKMPLTEQVFAALVTAYGVNGDPDSARGVFDLMRENGTEPDLDSYSALLFVYGEAGNLEAILKTIDEMQEKHVYPNRKLYLSLMDILSKRGHNALIVELLRKPVVKTLVIGGLETLMLTVANRGELNTAFLLLGHLTETASPDYPCLHETKLLKHVILSGQPLDVVMVTIRELEKLGAFRNVYEDALDLSFGARNTEICLAILQEMLQKKMTVKTHYFFPLMAMYARKNDKAGAQDIINLMAEYGMQPDAVILRFLLESYGSPDSNDVESFLTLSEGVPMSRNVLMSMAKLVMMTGQLSKLEKIIEHAKQEVVNLQAIVDGFENYMKKRSLKLWINLSHLQPPTKIVGKVEHNRLDFDYISKDLIYRSFDPQNGVKVLEVLNRHDCIEGIAGKIANVIQDSSDDCTKDNAEFVSQILKAGLGHLLDSRSYTFMLGRFYKLRMNDEFYMFVQTMRESEVNLDEHHYRIMLRMMALDGKAEAAQFCYDKYQELVAPTDEDISFLITAYARCPEGGIHLAEPRERNMKRITQLFNMLWTKGLVPTNRAKAAACIAYLQTGQVEKAEQIRSIFDIGEPKFRVLSQFMRTYAYHGDVAKTLEFYEQLKQVKASPTLPCYIYNNLLTLYGFHGDTDSQQKVFEEMKQSGVKPNDHTYSELMKTYMLKDDLTNAMRLFQDAKEQDLFPSHSVCLQLLNCMARTGQTEHFESVMEDIIANKIKFQISKDPTRFIAGLVYAAVHAGMKDLIVKLQLEHDMELSSRFFIRHASNSGRRGEVDAILRIIEFLKENKLDYATMYGPLIDAYDARRDLDSVKAVYNKLVEDGETLNEGFLQHYNQILIKNSRGVNEPSHTGSTIETQTANEESDSSDSSSSDDERGHIEDTENDFEELDDPK